MMSVDMGCLICDAKFGFIIIFMDLKHSKFGSRPICFSKPYHVSHHKFICKILSAVLLVLCLGSFSLHVLRYVTSVVYAPPFSYVGKTTNGAMFHYMKSTRELRSYGLFCSKQWKFLTDFQRNPIGTSFRGQESNWPETSGRNYRYSLHNNPQECSSQLLYCGSLKSRKELT